MGVLKIIGLIILGLFALGIVALPLLVIIPACMISSKISQEEERKYLNNYPNKESKYNLPEEE